MPVFAFRAQSLLVVDAPSGEAAPQQAAQLADLLSGLPYGRGITHVTVHGSM